MPQLSPKAMWLTAAVIAVLTVAAVVVLWWPATAGLTGDKLVSNRLDALKIGLSIGLGSGGVVALYLSWRRQDSTERTLVHQQEVHTTTMAHQNLVARNTEHDAAQRRLNELYLKAVEQLGSPKAAVRHGGLYALEQVAQDDPKRQQTVVNVICAYLRGPYTPPPDTAGPRPLGVRRPLLTSTDRPRTPASAPNGGTREDQLQEREVRLTAQRILHQNLQPGPDPDHPRPEFWRAIDLDLTGATLIDFSLAHCRIANASFRKTTFIGGAWFAGAEFGGGAWFTGAKFGGYAEFAEAKFGSYAEFGGAEFGGYADFAEAKFDSYAVFDEAKFGGKAEFGGAEFGGRAGFGGAKFGGVAWFGDAKFGGVAGFAGAKFGDGFGFTGAKFGDEARFDDAKFGGDAWFDDARFGGVTWFGGAEFGGEAVFGGAVFGGYAVFDDAVCDGRVFDPAEHGVILPADEPDSTEGQGSP
ncbi:pentapeptide repeat-containing protein [Amycolatopsis sp. NBC_00438]|uniref:pentapeptide repeat-containing protein n=1 Tax=Amycolatopsis sp. NBC_00438 TaxID=2903558 RepID=UPI002E207163